MVTEPSQTRNTRDPRLDLDSVYGGGPSVSPQLYNSADRAKFRIESGGLFEDLPRNSDLTAIIADRRNDENLMIAGLTAAFLLAHNRTVDLRRANSLPGDPWLGAQQTIMHHWQSIVVNEFLPQIVGRSLVDDILRNGRRWYQFTKPTMPVEFQTGAYRFGHSLVRRRTTPTSKETPAAIPRRARRPSSRLSSTRPARAKPTRSTCAVGRGHRGGSSAGNPSSTSAAIRLSRCGRTS